MFEVLPGELRGQDIDKLIRLEDDGEQFSHSGRFTGS
jgi:hypothetical protein